MNTTRTEKLSAPMAITLRFIASDARDCYSFGMDNAPQRQTYSALEARGLITARPGEAYKLTDKGRAHLDA